MLNNIETERFKKVQQVIVENDLSFNSRNIEMFKKLYDSGKIENSEEVKLLVDKINAIEEREENNLNKYSETIMQYLRQRRRLDMYDVIEDDEINKMSPSDVFENVCKWNGLLGEYHETIKYWVENIYNTKLD